LAFSRRDKEAILEIKETVSPDIQAEIEERLRNFNKK
jgi:hypothetical protein